jgi:hypothetical protein
MAGTGDRERSFGGRPHRASRSRDGRCAVRHPVSRRFRRGGTGHPDLECEVTRTTSHWEGGGLMNIRHVEESGLVKEWAGTQI